MLNKDFMGEILSVGDTVVMVPPGYRMFCKGTVTAFTPKKVRVSYINTWNYSTGDPAEIIQDAVQLVKV